MQTPREMADEIMADMSTWTTPQIRDARYDEASQSVTFRMDLEEPLFEVRFRGSNCTE